MRCDACSVGNHGSCDGALGRALAASRSIVRCGCACVPGPKPMPTVDDVRAAWQAGRMHSYLETLRLRRQGTGPRRSE